MTRIEWDSYPGEDVEEAVAMYVQRQHFLSQTVRPSVGDGGIDVRVPLLTGGDDIYQVKKFAKNLTGNQKNQIERSFKRLSEYAKDNEIKVKNWYLVMPLNPTKENLVWFKRITKGAGFGCHWLGRTAVNNWASDFPTVADYFFHGGRDELLKLQAAMSTVETAQRDVKRGNKIEVGDMRDTLMAMKPLLERVDPYYEWEFRLTKSRPTGAELAASGAICHQQHHDAAGWLTVSVLPRYAEATEKSPIRVQFTVKAPKGSGLEADIKSFNKFGTPVEFPAGSVEGLIDMPGGLGGSLENMTLLLSPAATEVQHLRMSLHEPDNKRPTVQVPVEVTQHSVGPTGKGAHVEGQSKDGVFEFEFWFDMEEQTSKVNLTRRDVGGRVAADVVDGLRFLAALRPGLHIGFAQPHGPVTDFLRPDPGGKAGDWEAIRGEGLLSIVEDLATLQEHTTEQVRLNESDEGMTRFDLMQVRACAKVLRGEVAAMPNVSYDVTGEWEQSPPTGAGPHAFEATLNMLFNFNDTVVDLGEFYVGCERIDILEMPSEAGVARLKFKPMPGFALYASLDPGDVTPVRLREVRELAEVAGKE